MENVYIVAAKRTPIGSFGGKLSKISATELGAHAIQGTMKSCAWGAEKIDEVLMGNVLSAGLGQAPARQAARQASIADDVPATTVNKVCASGMKAVMLGASSVALGHNDAVMVGGMESMTRVPYYIPKGRYGHNYGHGKLVDGVLHDGLWEAYHEFPMGNCAEVIAKDMQLSRQAQDDYAKQSYERAAAATAAGHFKKEIYPVAIPQRKGEAVMMDEDEEYTHVVFEKIPKLRPVFDKEGTVTAANASTISDGAAALLLASESKVQALGLKPLAKIVAYADAAQAPLYFTTSPRIAIEKTLQRAKVSLQEVEYFEINEAFAAVALANIALLKLDPARVNVFGGAVALGHPLGCSGARILVTLLSVLQHKHAKLGMAAICNGGGGASALLLERVGA